MGHEQTISGGPEFPTDVNRQTSQLYPLIGELDAKGVVGIEPNQLTALYRESDAPDAYEMAQVAVLTFDQASQSYLPAMLARAADGAIEIKAMSPDAQDMRVIVQGAGIDGFGVVTRLDGEPIIVKQTSHSPNRYEELLSIPGDEDESPKDAGVRAAITALGMDPDSAVEITARVCYPPDRDTKPLEGYLMGQRGGEGELSLEIAQRLPHLDLYTTRGATRGGTRGFSFGETHIGEGTVHQTSDTFYRTAAFQFRMAAI